MHSPLTITDVRTAAGGLLARPDAPTAIITNSDYTALGIYLTARDLSLRIGPDISVIGHDDLPTSELLDPPLATIRLDGREMGRALMARLLDRNPPQRLRRPGGTGRTRLPPGPAGLARIPQPRSSPADRVRAYRGTPCGNSVTFLDTLQPLCVSMAHAKRFSCVYLHSQLGARGAGRPPRRRRPGPSGPSRSASGWGSFQEALVRSPYRFALAGVAALTLLAAGCSSSSSSGSSASSSSTGSAVNWATETSASAGGGMSALVAAAKKEGTLNVIALPPTWANYGAIIKHLREDVRDQGQFRAARRHQPAGSRRGEAGERHPQGARRAGHRHGRRPGQHQPVRAVRGEHLERHPRRPEGADRALGPGLRRLHGDRLLEQVRHDHLAEPAARPAVQERGRAERQPDLGQRGPERRHDGEPRRGRIGRQHRRRACPSSTSSRRPATSRRSRRPAPRSRRARPRSCSTGTTSTCPSYVGRVELEGVRPVERRPRRVLRAGHQQERAAPGGGPAVGGVPLLAGRDRRAEPVAAGRRPAGGAAGHDLQRHPSTPRRPRKLPAVTGTPVFLTPTQATDAANYLAANWAKAVG